MKQKLLHHGFVPRPKAALGMHQVVGTVGESIRERAQFLVGSYDRNRNQAFC